MSHNYLVVAFFILNYQSAKLMVLQIKGEYYLNRAEAVSYFLQGYHTKWCYSRWSKDAIAFSFETKEGLRDRILLKAYKANKSKVVRVRKFDVDNYFMTK